ncbi:hypothetical protein [uncultured Rikenella sp.]|uniref:hypothetical protein n=1 Tax=uncultured Rikenella sp. TaxID=368003 RepID=UPI002729D9F7|nr:hypothetical protein [uncultured Rikenella sp.]
MIDFGFLGTQRYIFFTVREHRPGYRGYTLGEAGSSGHHGFSWSSAASGIYGLNLIFYSQSLTTSYSGSRAYGLQWRCLSE